MRLISASEIENTANGRRNVLTDIKNTKGKKIYRLKGYRIKNYRKSIKSTLIMVNTG